MRVLLLLLALAQAATPTTTVSTTLVLDDDRKDKIEAYRFVLDTQPPVFVASKPTPCVDCATYTYELATGMHTLTVTPYTATGTLAVQRYTLTVKATVKTTVAPAQGQNKTTDVQVDAVQAAPTGRGQSPRR